MEISEGNNLIAEFMGEGLDLYYLYYHRSWEILMPVVEKIEGLGYTVEICGYSCVIYLKDSEKHYGKSKIEAVWQAVVQFIQWYKNK